MPSFKSKWKIATMLSLATTLFTFASLFVFSRASRTITQSNYALIKLGMTKYQVEKILGRPRWEVKPQNPMWIDPESVGNMLYFPDEWWGVEGVIQIWYQEDVVSDKDFATHRCEVAPLGIWDRILVHVGVLVP